MFRCFYLLCLIFPLNLWGLSPSLIAKDPAWDSIAWISIEARIENDSTTAFCNATWLTHNLLITAAHCVSHAYILRNSDIVIELGSYQKHNFKGFAFIKRIETKAKFIFLPSLQNRLNQNRFKTKIHPAEDLALILLEKNFNFPFIKLAKLLPLNYFNSIKNDPLDYWPTVVSINLFETLSHTDSRQMAKLDAIHWSSYFKSQSITRIAEGDSGAPLFFRVGTEWYIGGVVKGRGENFIKNWDAFTSIEPVHSLLRNLN